MKMFATKIEIYRNFYGFWNRLRLLFGIFRFFGVSFSSIVSDREKRIQLFYNFSHFGIQIVFFIFQCGKIFSEEKKIEIFLRISFAIFLIFGIFCWIWATALQIRLTEFYEKIEKTNSNDFFCKSRLLKFCQIALMVAPFLVFFVNFTFTFCLIFGVALKPPFWPTLFSSSDQVIDYSFDLIDKRLKAIDYSFDLISCSFDLISCSFDLISYSFDLIDYSFDLQ